MARVRTRKGERGPNRRTFIATSPTEHVPVAEYEKITGQKVYGTWNGSKYFDNGYGYYFDYDVEIPEDPNGEIKLDGRTHGEVEALRDKEVKLLGQGVVDAYYRNDPDAMDSPEEGDESLVGDVDFGDLMYFDAMLGNFEYWENQPLEDIKQYENLTYYPAESKARGSLFFSDAGKSPTAGSSGLLARGGDAWTKGPLFGSERIGTIGTGYARGPRDFHQQTQICSCNVKHPGMPHETSYCDCKVSHPDTNRL